MINLDWLGGLIDGEGSFSLLISIRPSCKLGVNIRPSFSITLEKKQENLLRRIRDDLNMGEIYERESRSQIVWAIQKMEDCIKLSKILNVIEMNIKRPDFEKWCNGINIIQNGINTKEDILKIAELRDRMNLSFNGKKNKGVKYRTTEDVKQLLVELGVQPRN